MNTVDPNTCKAVILDPASHRIFSLRDSTGVHLPTVHLDPGVRQARGFQKALSQRYRLETLQLAELPSTEGAIRYSVHEQLKPSSEPGLDHLFLPLAEIRSDELPAPQRSAITALLHGETQDLGRFARLGWIEELRSRVGAKELHDIRQVNCGIDFCLLSMRYEAERGWFKAVGEPNTREFALTLALSRKFPDYLPPIVMAIPEWNGWIAEDVDGIPLNQTSDPAAWEVAFTALATMQRETADDTRALFAAGALDGTSERLMHLLDPFFEDGEQAMRAQTSDRVLPLGWDAMRSLRASLETVLLETMASGLPETLLHGDIGHGNVIVSGRGPIFLDWAETSIGCPFLSAEHLLADLDRSFSLSQQQKTTLRRSYAAHWADWVDGTTLQRIVQAAPALAAFAYAARIWEYHRHSASPENTWPLLRAMLRRTQCELEQADEVMA